MTIGPLGSGASKAPRDQVLEIIHRAADLSRHKDVATDVSSDYAKFLTVLVAGCVETTVEDSVRVYAAGFSDARIGHYIGKKLDSFHNPIRENIISLFGDFGDDLRTAVKELLKPTESAALALQSVMANRHQIAHGSNSDVTLDQITQWYEDLAPLLEGVSGLLH